jgi:hypothetical protein
MWLDQHRSMTLDTDLRSYHINWHTAPMKRSEISFLTRSVWGLQEGGPNNPQIKQTKYTRRAFRTVVDLHETVYLQESRKGQEHVIF